MISVRCSLFAIFVIVRDSVISQTIRGWDRSQIVALQELQRATRFQFGPCSRRAGARLIVLFLYSSYLLDTELI